MRLSAPTNRTFFLALAMIILGIVLWIAPVDIDSSPDFAFWLATAGGVLLAVGSLFNRI